MSAVFAIARRETAAYFASPIGWIVLLVFQLMTGWMFLSGLIWYADASAQMMMNPYGGDSMDANSMVLQPLFGNMAVIVLLFSPAVTMRLLAEDTRMKSFELLLTSPISSFQIALGKLLGALGFGVALVLSTAHFVLILRWLGDIDTGILMTNYLNFSLMLGMLFAIGLFCSALTENQVVALALAFSANLLLFIFGWAAAGMEAGTAKEVIEYISMVSHVEQMGKGLIHIKDLAYYLTFIGFALFATTQRVEAMRWR